MIHYDFLHVFHFINYNNYIENKYVCVYLLLARFGKSISKITPC